MYPNYGGWNNKGYGGQMGSYQNYRPNYYGKPRTQRYCNTALCISFIKDY